MPKKRTKRQKARATYHYAYPAGRSFVGLNAQDEPVLKASVHEKANDSTLYLYDPKYTRNDLAKTLVVTLAMIAVEVGLYFWL